jgi:hypothetical protein
MLQLANLQLSRSQMKEIRGGYDDGGMFAPSCEAKCKDGINVAKCGPCAEGVRCYAQDYGSQGGSPLSDGGCRCGSDSWTMCSPPVW